MAAIDVERQDPLTFFRTEVSPRDLAIQRAQWEVERQHDANAAATALTALITIAVLMAMYALHHRRKIAKAADSALISGLATGVRAARVTRSRKDAFITRVLARADEKTPEPD